MENRRGKCVQNLQVKQAENITLKLQKEFTEQCATLQTYMRPPLSGWQKRG